VTEADILALVLGAVQHVNQARKPEARVQLAPDAPLFGSGALDSLGLVMLLIDIEEALEDRGYGVNLSDANAMSRTRSPFRNVPSLVAYIQERIGAVA
jgi:acyl carrier protein